MKSNILLMGCLFFIGAKALGQTQISQSLFGSTGGVETTESYLVSYSFGEPISSTVGNSEFILTQGFQQPDDIVIRVNEYESLGISIYPNPTSGKVKLELTTVSPELRAKIHDVNGKLVLLINSFDSDIQTIDLSKYSDGIYTISILENEKLLKSTQIIRK